MKCVVCGTEFEAHNNQKTCSDKCSRENKRTVTSRFNKQYYKSKLKGRRVFTEEQIEANRKRNRENYWRKKEEKNKKDSKKT